MLKVWHPERITPSFRTVHNIGHEAQYSRTNEGCLNTWILIIEKAKYIESQGTNDKLGTPILKRIEYVYIHPMIWTIARPPQCM